MGTHPALRKGRRKTGARSTALRSAAATAAAPNTKHDHHPHPAPNDCQRPEPRFAAFASPGRSCGVPSDVEHGLHSHQGGRTRTRTRHGTFQRDERVSESTREDGETPPVPVGLFGSVSLDVCVGTAACTWVSQCVVCGRLVCAVWVCVCVCVCKSTGKTAVIATPPFPVVVLGESGRVHRQHCQHAGKPVSGACGTVGVCCHGAVCVCVCVRPLSSVELCDVLSLVLRRVRTRVRTRHPTSPPH